MKLVLLGFMTILLICCVVVWPTYSKVRAHFHNRVTSTMTSSLAASVGNRIEHGGMNGDQLALREADFDVNTEERFGHAGWEVTSTGIAIFGVRIQVTDRGLTITAPGPAIFIGSVEIDQGRITLESPSTPKIEVTQLYGQQAIASVIERGLNDALKSHGLAPVSVDLATGVMTISVRRLHGKPLATAATASPTAALSVAWAA